MNIKYDPTLKVGDIVLNNYSKDYYLYRIIKLQRRFHDQKDVDIGYGKLGEEYAPLVTIERVASISFVEGKVKKQKPKQLDISWTQRVTKKDLEEHMLKLQNTIRLLDIQ
jgi:hypothetical protein